jgi:glutamyl endopeptidase
MTSNSSIAVEPNGAVDSYTGDQISTAVAADTRDSSSHEPVRPDCRRGSPGEIENPTGGPSRDEDDRKFVLDACYAGVPGRLVVEALERRLARASGSFWEVVIGTDDRVRVNATTEFPWRAICSLEITAADGTLWTGTGWFISPRTVMTAGHCVFMAANGGWVQNIRVIPGRNENVRPYGSVVATAFRSVRGWTEQGKSSHDYGAILLPAGSPLGNTVGWFGFANLSSTALAEMTVNLAGYPGDKLIGTQWFHSRKLKAVDDLVLTYDIDTAGGQSGAPVWRSLNGQRHAVGIHNNGSWSGNLATRIEQTVFDNMMKWKAEGA